jgi:hypothetical protein
VGAEVVGIRQSLLQKVFGGFAVPRLGKIEVYDLPWLSTARNRYSQRPAIRTKVSSMSRWKTSVSRSRAAVGRPLVRTAQPTPDGRVVHRQARSANSSSKFRRLRKPAVPPHAGHNKGWFKLAFPEQRRPTRFHAVTLPDPLVQQFRRSGWTRSGKVTKECLELARSFSTGTFSQRR